MAATLQYGFTPTFDQFLTFRSLLELLSQIVRLLLTLEFVLFRLQGPAHTVRNRACILIAKTADSRGSIATEEDVAILQILNIWALLEVFLERVPTLNGGDRSFVDLQVRSVLFV